jgi:hypothetical protein
MSIVEYSSNYNNKSTDADLLLMILLCWDGTNMVENHREAGKLTSQEVAGVDGTIRSSGCKAGRRTFYEAVSERRIEWAIK